MGFHNRESHTLKTAVVAPMPSASVSTAVTAKSRRFAQHALAVTDILPQVHEIARPRKEYARKRKRVRKIVGGQR